MKKGPLSAYSVEKLGSSGNSINFGELAHSNSLFLLGRVSADMPENRRMGVFQQNRPVADLKIEVFSGDGDDPTHPAPLLS